MSDGWRAWLRHLISGGGTDVALPTGRTPDEVRRAEETIVRGLGEVRGRLGEIDARVKALEVAAGIVARDYAPPRREEHGNGHTA